ncbi:hypothetical protein HA466_0272320 [Hirschfeldia incana]|nr:hypothetical protein HA466_0272320 [Hirschfeldia incana]
MNPLWFLRSVLALSFMIMMMSNTAMSGTGNVLIRNSLQNQKDLIVHCKSVNKDMGYHRVHPTGSYNLLYKLHYDSVYYEDNHIWCHVWQGHGFKHHQVFNVYSGDHWEAREDGIYRQEDGIYHREIFHQWKMMYVWDATISKASSFGSSCISVGLLLASSLFF